MTGYIALFIALAATGGAIFCYLNALGAAISGGREQRAAAGERQGLFFFRLSALGVAAASGYLFYLIFSDQFQFAYVFGHSSRDLSLVYKFSAFWAGQEGSFLLWALFHAVFGLCLPRRNFAGAMAVYAVLQSMLLVTLLAKSPFMMLVGPQSDGFGLNPLLQDPWMAIHPPLIFLGYAGLAVPFAYAMDGLLTGRHANWLNRALPWTLFSWGILGAGIVLGGFWAYKVLGWGGYWAWDPVENSSLVPWLACGALLHLLLLARVRIAAVRTAYFAAIFTFVLVMYGTFLTRSGILSDFSTHSFADEGVGGLLACFVMLTAAMALGLLIVRWPRLPQGELYPEVKSREFHLAAAAIIFTAIGAIVLVGMSTPLITMLLGNPQNVGIEFYSTSTLPLAAVLATLLITGQLAGWGGKRDGLLKRYWWLVLAGHIAGIAVFWAGIRQPLAIVTASLALTALIAAVTVVRRKLLPWPAGLVHAGAAITLIGILFSSVADQSVFVNFTKGESRQVLGAELTYLGDRPAEDGAGFYQSFALRQPARVIEAFTKLDREGRHAAHEPGIYRGMTADLYLAPVAQHGGSQEKEIIIGKGQQVQAEGLAVRLHRIGMARGEAGGDIRVYALLEVMKDGRLEEVRPELVSREGKMNSVPFTAFGHYQVALTSVNPGDGTAGIRISDLTAPPEQERVDVEVSRKPFINFMWLGTLMMTGGIIWAGAVRAKALHGVAQPQAVSRPPKSL